MVESYDCHKHRSLTPRQRRSTGEGRAKTTGQSNFGAKIALSKSSNGERLKGSRSTPREEFLSDARGVYYTSESSKDLTGRRQLDIFIKRKTNASGTAHNWKDVQVIGEHKTSNSKDFKPLLLQLGRYMRVSVSCGGRSFDMHHTTYNSNDESGGMSAGKPLL